MKTSIVWIFGTFIPTLSWPVFANGPDRSVQAEITVAVYDVANIGPKTLVQAEELASSIFSLAGADVQWRAGPLSETAALVNDFSRATPDQCAQPLPAAGLRVQILSHAPQGFRSGALGYSLPCSTAGIQVTLYADRMEGVSRSTAAVFYRVLGHALAHELGHVLLKSPHHSSSGIMKAVWTKSDWQRAAVSGIPFAPDQRSQILFELRAAKSEETLMAYKRGSGL